jgi:hypothetical protein
MSCGAGTDRDIEGLIARALGGHESAWMRLLSILWERVETHVGHSRRMGQLRGSPDDRREVVSRVFARLRRNDLRALRTFTAWRARNHDKTFDDWLAIVVTNVIRDYVTERLGDVDDAGRGLKRLIHTLADTLDCTDRDAADGREPRLRPAITNTIAAAELVAFARVALPVDQLAVLTRWLAGEDFAEIAAAQGCADAAVARATLRAALARLRRGLRDRDEPAEVVAR